MATIAIINRNTNIVENIGIDDRDASEIQLPDPYFAVNIDKTTCVNEETTGQGGGGIGYKWDGIKLIHPIHFQENIEVVT